MFGAKSFFFSIPFLLSFPALASYPTTIAVIDSGVASAHERLAGHVWLNQDETQGDQDRDGNGYVADVAGWDFRQGDNAPDDEMAPIPPAPECAVFSLQGVLPLPRLNVATDRKFNWDCFLKKGAYTIGRIAELLLPGSEGHGTHVAGIAQKISVNGKIMPLRVDYSSSEFFEQVRLAVEYAAANGAKVVNMSFGTYLDKLDETDQTRLEALKKTMKRHPGVLFVIAAGNENIDMKSEKRVIYPAGFLLDNSIVVGAVNDAGELADFSNIGEGIVDVFAPGVEIESTWPGPTNQELQNASGTSMSSPFIAGLAARIWENAPKASAAQVKSLILKKAQKRWVIFNKKSDSTDDGATHSRPRRIQINSVLVSDL